MSGALGNCATATHSLRRFLRLLRAAWPHQVGLTDPLQIVRHQQNIENAAAVRAADEDAYLRMWAQGRYAVGAVNVSPRPDTAAVVPHVACQVHALPGHFVATALVQPGVVECYDSVRDLGSTQPPAPAHFGPQLNAVYGQEGIPVQWTVIGCPQQAQGSNACAPFACAFAYVLCMYGSRHGHALLSDPRRTFDGLQLRQWLHDCIVNGRVCAPPSAPALMIEVGRDAPVPPVVPPAPHRGIVNVGNTCFLAAAAQLLSVVPQWPCIGAQASHGLLAKMSLFLAQLRDTTTNQPVRPQRLVEVAEAVMPEWQRGQMMDATEFIDSLLAQNGVDATWPCRVKDTVLPRCEQPNCPVAWWSGRRRTASPTCCSSVVVSFLPLATAVLPSRCKPWLTFSMPAADSSSTARTLSC